MIRETKRKIYFTSYVPATNKKEEIKPPYVRVNVKNETIAFSRDCIDQLNMNNKFIKFYHNSKNIIGWQVTDSLTQGDLASKTHRLVKQNPKSGIYVTTIGPLLSQLEVKLDQPKYKCEVVKYKEMSDVLSRGDIFYFIKLGKKEQNED